MRDLKGSQETDDGRGEGSRIIGADIDLNRFHMTAVPHAPLEAAQLINLPEDEQRQLAMSGLDLMQETRAGTFFQKDTAVVHCSTRQDGLEIIPMRQALESAGWVSDHYWQLLPADMDQFTAAAERHLHDGYAIRALPGSRSSQPFQACLYIGNNGLQQNVHNIVVVEEGAELHIINGCTVSPHLNSGLHVGVTEFFIRRNARLTVTMIHNWNDRVQVRPRSAARVEAGGLFISNYVCLKPVGSLQMDPVVYLSGHDAVARFYHIVAGSPNAFIDTGGRVFLQQQGTRAEINARVISNGGHIITRGHLVGEVPGIKAHVECRGLILNGGVIHAIPELEGRAENVEMSHEAAVGKIAQEEILYLMARGLTEDQAVSTIVRGFLTVDIPDLPPALKAEIDRVVTASDSEMM